MYNLLRITDKYIASDQDVAADPSYFGFVDHNGNWYILEINTANGTLRYASGRADTSLYTTNWTGRAGLTYDYFYNVTIY